MMGLGPSHLLILLVLALVLLGGKGKISSIMGDVADGIKQFKKGMSDDTKEAKREEEQKTLEAQKTLQGSATGSTNKVG